MKIRRFRETSMLRYLTEKEVCEIPENYVVYAAAQKDFNARKVFPNEAKSMEDKFLVNTYIHWLPISRC